MKIHILGICGTFMGGLAVLARAAGHEVSGTDAHVYPPMSTLLESEGIDVYEGYDAAHLQQLQPDVVVIGNALSRGNAMVEAVLERNLPYTSGPQWLAEHVLQQRWVVAVAGTHGKTTTASMVAWILEQAGLAPGFLIGGVPLNFGCSARLGQTPFFVVEADEYDTAFFDKRSKFIHYRPRTLILNNLEYDHADIFPDLAAIQTQFHHLVRTVPANGKIMVNDQAALAEVLTRGCWTPTEEFSQTGSLWSLGDISTADDAFNVLYQGEVLGRVQWNLSGRHNQLNALAAIAAARHTGVPVGQAIEALSSFDNVKRRMELRGQINGIKVFDDFAHHPTAITTTLAGARAASQADGPARLLAVLEPRSNTMRMGIHQKSLAAALQGADDIFIYTPADLGWDVRAAMTASQRPVHCHADMTQLIEDIAQAARPGDHIIIMSNGGFGGIHDGLLQRLAQKMPA